MAGDRVGKTLDARGRFDHDKMVKLKKTGCADYNDHFLRRRLGLLAENVSDGTVGIGLDRPRTRGVLARIRQGNRPPETPFARRGTMGSEDQRRLPVRKGRPWGHPSHDRLPGWPFVRGKRTGRSWIATVPAGVILSGLLGRISAAVGILRLFGCWFPVMQPCPQPVWRGRLELGRRHVWFALFLSTGARMV